MHSWGYAHGLATTTLGSLAAVWDDDAERGKTFAEKFGATFVPNLSDLWGQVDAVIITSENMTHIDHLEAAHAAGKPALCEKPIVPTEAHGERLKALIDAGAKIMTAFPCRYSPAFLRTRDRVKAGDLGPLMAICATNRGRCPFSWFVEKDKSGGGAMIDHVVHVADLLHAMLGEDVVRVQASIGSNMYGKDWDDTAMLTLEFESGLFATLDSSWSRPQNYKTWGDVTMNVVGEKGALEMDMFGQQFEVYRSEPNTFGVAGFGSDLDAGLVRDFLRFAAGEIEAPITALDGWKAARVALAGYRSASTGQPVSV